MTLKEMEKSHENALIKHSPLTRRLLVNRGIFSEGEAEAFLNPSYENHVGDPFLMTDLSKAVDRIYQAVVGDERICVFADYDCDGIPGAVIMHDFFNKLPFKNFEIYIPDRHTEGYGLNKEALDEIAGRGAKLLITVDLGITAIEDVDYANSLGLSVIITDHHLPKEELPKAFAVVNPKRDGDVYPDNMLCGSGVAFKLIQGFLKKYGKEFAIPVGWDKWLLDMVGLATLSDMVPLRKENRALAHFGMQVLRKTRRPGMLALFRHAKLDSRNLQEEDLTFSIVPKLNAAGRMDSPRRAFDLLSSDEANAPVHADYLSKINDERKLLVANIMRSLKRNFLKREEKSVIVLGDPAWRIGILGLVAGKIVDEYKKPAFVWGLEGGTIIKGSCRSDGTVNLVEMMNVLPENSLLEFGGHAGAGGFSVNHEQIQLLEERLVEAYEKTKKEIVEEKGISVDAELDLDEVNENTFNEINRLAPFGVENAKPVFAFPQIEISEVKVFGKTKEHLELAFKSARGMRVKAIQFFKTPEDFGEMLKVGNKINLIAHMEKSLFGFKKEIRLRIIEIK